MAELLAYELAKDRQPFAAFNIDDAATKNRTLGSATTAENIPIGTNEVLCLLAADQDCWFNLTAVATTPTGDVDANGSHFLAAGTERWFTVRNATDLSIVSAIADAHIEANFWTDG